MRLLKFVPKALKLLIFSLMIALGVNVIQYPEKYMTTWKYQLYNDLKAGDRMAIEYYQKTYLSRGKVLFDDIDNEEFFSINFNKAKTNNKANN